MSPEGEAADRAAAELAGIYRRRFGAPAEVVTRAPGRVTLVGAHVDYSEGMW